MIWTDIYILLDGKSMVKDACGFWTAAGPACPTLVVSGSTKSFFYLHQQLWIWFGVRRGTRPEYKLLVARLKHWRHPMLTIRILIVLLSLNF